MQIRSAVLCGVLLAAAALVPAHAQAAASVYVVTYYETVTSAGAPAALLARYRDGTVREPGAVSIKVLSDADRPSRYVVVEQWDSADALAKHRAAAAMQQLQQDMAGVLAGPIDHRLHAKFE